MICRGGGGGGGGGFIGRAAGQKQPQQQQQQEPPVQLRLFFLTQHLVLQCFNPLDDLSRKNAFEVMGWSRDNYLKRQQALREQIENAKKVKMMKQKEEEEKKRQQQQEEDSPVVEDEEEEETDEVEEEGVTANEGEEGLNDAEEAAPDTAETGVEEVEEAVSTSVDKGGESGGEEKTDIVTQNETELDDINQSSPEDDDAEKNDEQGEMDGVDEKTDDTTQEEPQIDDNDNPLLLPLLSAPIDPQTLLDRLNTRRLYSRLLYYKREQKRKVEEEAAKALSGDNAEGDANGELDAEMPGMGGPIQKMYRDLLKEKVTMDRVWRKNMTIEELANLEWNELLKVAELR